MTEIIVSNQEQYKSDQLKKAVKAYEKLQSLRPFGG